MDTFDPMSGLSPRKVQPSRALGVAQGITQTMQVLAFLLLLFVTGVVLYVIARIVF